VRDLDGVHHAWLAAHGAASALVRPDFHVYGTAGPGGCADLVAGLTRRLRGA
jgi:flavoprotein hydroxylase